MKEQALILSPHIRILHRKGVLFAGQLSGAIEPVQLLEFDIVILHAFLNASTPGDVVNEILDGNTREVLSSVPSQPALLGRIHENHVLLDLRTVAVEEEGHIPDLVREAWAAAIEEGV